jgi:uncharacterized protein YfaP (DUF2135 family)
MPRRRSDPGLGFTDLLFNALLGFVLLFVLAMLLINPVARSGAIDPKAEFLITLSWPEEHKDDVDLYVQDPAGNLVWFRRREAGLMHLDRDDLGRSNDVVRVAGLEVVNPLNQEIVTLRGVVPGEHVVNVHLYRFDGDGPVPATVRVEKLNPTVKLIFHDDLQLSRQGEEKTALRFTVRRDGEVVAVTRLAKHLVPGRAPGVR